MTMPPSPLVNVSSVCLRLPSPPQAICVGPENLQVMYPAIFEQLLLFVEFSCKPPQYGRMETKHVANAKYNQVTFNQQPCLVLFGGGGGGGFGLICPSS